jgi:predicted transcriptional regulator of viral defense system
MWAKTFASRVLRELANHRRRVVADWRILVIARRLSHAENAPLPDEKKAAAIRNELVQRGAVVPEPGVSGVYVVDVAYANLLDVSEEQIVQEANPWAVFSFLTAMTYHGLTDLASPTIHAATVKSLGGRAGKRPARLPLGTTPDDWADDVPPPSLMQPKKVRGVSVNWTQLAEDSGFGVTVGYSFGVPIYVTDVERTLLDALRAPDKSGGIAKVLQAWQSAEGMNLDKLVGYADAYDNQVLLQRVGYLLEKLGRTHPRLEEWRRGKQRGGSMKLVANAPYSNTYSAEWNLSLNVPPSVLAIIEEDYTLRGHQ